MCLCTSDTHTRKTSIAYYDMQHCKLHLAVYWICNVEFKMNINLNAKKS